MFNLKINSTNKEEKTKLVTNFKASIIEDSNEYKIIDDNKSYEIVIGKENLKDNSTSIELMIRKTINIDSEKINNEIYMEKLLMIVREFINKSRDAEEIFKIDAN